MQYLGHKSLETTQIYLKEVLLDDKLLAAMMQEESREESKEGTLSELKIGLPQKRKRRISQPLSAEAKVLRSKKSLLT